MTEKVENIPKLRFPEFVNNGEWKRMKLKGLGEFQGGGTPSKKNKSYWTGDIPWISSSDVYDNDIFNISITRYINEESIKNSATKLIPEKSVLFVSRVGVGKFVVNEIPVCTSQDFTNFIPKKVNSYFMAYSFLANTNKLIKLVQGTSIKGFTTKDLKKTAVCIPENIIEQQKIADCLSSLDDLIIAQKEKLDVLKEHKRGLLQNLFPQEGEKVPKYRFPEFENDGEWEEKKLGKVFKTYSGGTPRTTNKNYYDGAIPFIRSAEIGESKTELSLTQEGLDNSSAKMVREGDLLIALYGANSGDSAISKLKGAINQAILCLQSENSNVFTYHFLTFKKDIIVGKYIQGGQGNLSGKIVKSILIPFPSTKEQQKIAETLSSLDSIIEQQQEKINELEEHKKGLLQGLFPEMKN